MKTALAVALALASGSAAALGLGQIELKSKLGEPLLAEIAIVSSDPEELEQLRAGLASPETFARVGLRPPDGIVAKLRFEPALNAAGDAVIRVTSAEPIDQPALTFLVEVDWGQGRLVREYSTLLDAPRTVSAPLQPRIDAPVVAPSSQIVRSPVVAPPASPDVAPPDTVAAAPRADVPAPVATPAPQRASPAASVAQQSRESSEYGAIARGETLSQVAARLDLGISLEQAMIALLRENPEAFINGNINLLKQGAVLRVPPQAQLGDVGRTEASALVQAQLRQWRGTQPADAQPAATTPQPAAAVAVAAKPASTTRQAAGGARLEIVPPGASRATRAGTQSGISAGGEGEMLRQELQQTRETLAARDAELAEMQSRLAELEKLQGDQSQLLSMKDAELAAVQQRLASAQQTPPPVADAARTTSVLPWVVAGVALLLALLAGWAWSRRSAATRTFRAPPIKPRPSLADAFAPAPLAPAADDSTSTPVQAPIAAAGETAGVPATAQMQADAEASADALGNDGPLPFWDRRDRQPRVREAPAPKPTAADAVATPAWHDPKSAAVKGDTAEAASVPGQERLDLARAYLDLGDHVSARLLLAEVAGGSDPDHSRQATRMLRELE